MQTLESWCATFQGHLVLAAAERYALGRNTAGSLETLEELARLIPFAGANTALVIARDIRQGCGVWEGDGKALKASDLGCEEHALYSACIENIVNAGFSEGEKWRLA